MDNESDTLEEKESKMILFSGGRKQRKKLLQYLWEKI